MKKTLQIFFLFFATATIATAQNPQPLIAELTAGPLNWEYTSGGFVGQIFYPHTLGVTRGLEFFQTPAQVGSDTLSYRVSVNNQVAFSGITKLEYRNTIFGDQWVLDGFPLDGGPPMPPFVDLIVYNFANGIFEFAEECTDCYQHRYVSSPCVYSPAVFGNMILCPNETSVLSTQAYDNYQWYSSLDNVNFTAIPGAVSSTLTVDANDILTYFSVQVSLNGCTERSPGVMLDGWVFLLPYVMTEGNFSVGPNGETLVCPSDTLYFILGEPYNANIEWYLNGSPTGKTDDTLLLVNAPGIYTVVAAPDVCPNFISPLGVDLEVQVLPSPTPIVSQNGNLLSANNPANFVTFQWYLNGAAIPGATGPNFTPAISGAYTLIGTSANGCPSFPSNPIQVTISAIDDVPLPENALSVWPNPVTDGTAQLRWPADEPVSSVELFSLQGTLVRHFVPSTQNASLAIDVSGMPAGLYLIKVFGENGLRVGKLLVQ